MRFYLLVKLERKPIGIEKTTMRYLILQEPFEAGGSIWEVEFHDDMESDVVRGWKLLQVRNLSFYRPLKAKRSEPPND